MKNNTLFILYVSFFVYRNPNKTNFEHDTLISELFFKPDPMDTLIDTVFFENTNVLDWLKIRSNLIDTVFFENSNVLD